MRSAEELALAIDQGCYVEFAAVLIEADRRDAQIEVLRELRKRAAESSRGWGHLVFDMLAELEKGEGGA